jgi:AcrR family transcriptional regulator
MPERRPVLSAGLTGKSPQPGKRERTRARIIKAASEVIGERGWDRTSLEEVAARAGMTRGAIYGNFRSRDDLFLAVVEAHWKPIIPSPPHSGATLKERMRALGEAVAAAAPARRAQAVGAASFILYALTHEEMRSRVAQKNMEIYRGAAKRLRESIASTELRMPPDHFVRVVHALTDGLLVLRALTPDLITDKVIIDAFEALA